MSRTLSQQEIDALLLAAGNHADERRAPASDLQVARYNFRRPDRVSKEQLRSLHFLHDRYAVNLSSSLSAFLRAVTEAMEAYETPEVMRLFEDYVDDLSTWYVRVNRRRFWKSGLKLKV